MTKKGRYLSLDVFRGATVCLMITVNSPGEWGVQYGPLEHAAWHGVTLTDLVFPSFLFAVGNAMAFVMPKYEQQGDKVFWAKILKRTFLIFVIGFLLSWFPFYNFAEGAFKSFANTRTLGVLQRIACCYFFASVLIHYCSKKWVMIVSAFILIGYWLIVVLGGDLTDPYSMIGYVGNQLDMWILGEKHMYHGEGVAFDPEGILSTLPAVVNVVIGYLAGQYLVKKGHTYEVLAKLLLAGIVLIFIALCWDLFFPINKKIWTSSFVMVTTGIDLLVLAVLVFVLEIKQKRSWTYFFEVFGRNPLAIYILSIVLIKISWLIKIGDNSLQGAVYGFFKGFLDPSHASFLFAISFMLLNWLAGYGLDRRKIYLKV